MAEFLRRAVRRPAFAFALTGGLPIAVGAATGDALRRLTRRTRQSGRNR